ncbi:DUF4276 family protein [Ancylothrix sp. C2]|uniref:DUF4276 family protein n=1 Tax=Ancylothrix sp. D3o TaxID=2953691 RepID=UPI0021BB5134|nr:DUF4276 family protein [Ancylothrix sp. D3o]MCT7951618.1 DUF4276 family protein [Ancylothrix sp. D3o]
MIRLHIIAEGQTEEEFVNSVLAQHLADFNVLTDVHCVTTKRTKTRVYRGGLVNYEKTKNDILIWLKEDKAKEVRLTTMLDLYALPNEFPQFDEAKKISDPYQRVTQLEMAFANDINDYRFIPYIQLHEFEALILSNPNLLIERFPEYSINIEQLSEFCNNYTSPELINDGITTAPSKRIIEFIPSYKGAKVSVAPLMAQKIGLETIRSKCRHFNEWLISLENLNKAI